ncbi:hypothetical protein B0O99DRAFT_686125 [Bisporella sp. PMI_857]|nr:hypothetical protein B0O99DRAFT_686125 [Bisporella sp. PMI_857]
MEGESRPLLGAAAKGNVSPRSSSRATATETKNTQEMDGLSKTSQWIVLAVLSGGCAAFNGVFAKLTTTELTTSFATWVAKVVGLAAAEKGVEVVVRALFFGLNIVFNIIMWTLYTKALSRGSSTTSVAIMNTSSNFMITAILGFIIFSESLPPLWWLGAAMLVAGSVITGRACKEEEVDKRAEEDNGEPRYSSESERLLVGENLELHDNLEAERKKKQEEEDILDLGRDDESLHAELR